MTKYIINGNKKLFGKVEIESSKNALLPIICASVLASSPVLLKNVPHYLDIDNLLAILQSMGAKINWNNNNVEIDCSTIKTTIIPSYLAQKLRASIVLLGSLLAKYGHGKTSMPGGCNIGERPIDLHVDGFRKLGIEVEITDQIECDSTKFAGGRVRLKFPSVGATQNLILCSVLSYLKTTTIENCAKEPEVVDLCNFINKMGGKIYGAGTDTIVIVGVKCLHGVEYSAITDRIVSGTYMIATAMCGGKVKIDGATQENTTLMSILLNLGCTIDQNGDNIYISSTRGLCGELQHIQTGAYPNFATDLQSQTVAMLAISNGTYTVTENLFESRFESAKQLQKMGANIVINGKTATIFGKNNCLCGASVEAQDLRGGAALVLAGLAARGTTIVQNAQFVQRGYDSFSSKLALLGADITIKDE